MVKPEWGSKRICHSCGAAFYDLRRTPIVCPKCGAAYDPEAILKSRRSRAPSPEDKEVVAPVHDADEADVAAEADEEAEDVVEDVVAEDEEDEDLIEDASELGEDHDDMAEVVENLEDEEGR